MPITLRPRTGTSASVTMPAGLVKLMSHASGGQWRRIASASCSMWGDRAERIRDAAGAGGLLSKQPQPQGNLLVRDPPRSTAWADCGEHHVCSRECLLKVCGNHDGGCGTSVRGHVAEYRLNGRQPRAVHVKKDEFIHQPGERTRAQSPEYKGEPGIRRHRQS